MSSKKITYSSDFKLKVLDYYFKNGGDEIFGLKKKTAGHFNIDKKTINRMLNNPDMVKRARKLMSAKKATSNVKSSTSRQPVKTTVKNAKAGGNASKAAPASRMASSSQSSASSSTSNNNKATTSSTSSTKSISNSSRQVNHTASSGTSSINGGADRSTPSKSKPGGTEAKNSPGVQIFELPEDPDYSLLKKSISSSSNGVASLAKLLVTGTEEVRNVILNECDVILECKVCRNLFRSVVNFLAHKRIYCQEEFADVRTLFHKGDVQGVTSQSNTIVVEPEPPPDNENFNPVRTTVPSSHTSPLKPGSQSRPKHSAIDSIALKLARKRKAFHSSSSTHVGSSSYFQSLSEIGRNRDKLSRDCSVVLEDIGGVSNAVYQSYIPPGSTPKTSMSCIIDEASHSKSGITVAINQNGEIVKTAAGDVSSMDVEEESASAEARDLTCLLCNTRFATQKTLSVHQRSHHGFERCVYSCPICKTSFSSMWAVVRHLQITHKKNKNQIERLRKVVRKNVRKKMVYPSPGKNDAHSDIEKEGNDTTEEAEEEDGDEEDSNDSSSKASEVAVPKRGEVSSALQMSAHKGWRSKDGVRWMCNVCRKMFITRVASLAHVATHIVCNFEPKAVLVNIKNENPLPETKLPSSHQTNIKKEGSEGENSDDKNEDEAEDDIDDDDDDEDDDDDDDDSADEEENESASGSEMDGEEASQNLKKDEESRKTATQETVTKLKKKYMKIAVSGTKTNEHPMCKILKKKISSNQGISNTSFRDGKVLLRKVSVDMIGNPGLPKINVINNSDEQNEKSLKKPESPRMDSKKTVMVKSQTESLDEISSYSQTGVLKGSLDKNGSKIYHDKSKELSSSNSQAVDNAEASCENMSEKVTYRDADTPPKSISKEGTVAEMKEDINRAVVLKSQTDSELRKSMSGSQCEVVPQPKQNKSNEDLNRVNIAKVLCSETDGSSSSRALKTEDDVDSSSNFELATKKGLLEKEESTLLQIKEETDSDSCSFMTTLDNMKVENDDNTSSSNLGKVSETTECKISPFLQIKEEPDNDVVVKEEEVDQCQSVVGSTFTSDNKKEPARTGYEIGNSFKHEAGLSSPKKKILTTSNNDEGIAITRLRTLGLIVPSISKTSSEPSISDAMKGQVRWTVAGTSKSLLTSSASKGVPGENNKPNSSSEHSKEVLAILKSSNVASLASQRSSISRSMSQIKSFPAVKTLDTASSSDQLSQRSMPSKTSVKTAAAFPASSPTPKASSTYVAQLKKYADDSFSPSLGTSSASTKPVDQDVHSKFLNIGPRGKLMQAIQKATTPVSLIKKSQDGSSSSSCVPKSTSQDSSESKSVNLQNIAYRMTGTTVPIAGQANASDSTLKIMKKVLDTASSSASAKSELVTLARKPDVVHTHHSSLSPNVAGSKISGSVKYIASDTKNMHKMLPLPQSKVTVVSKAKLQTPEIPLVQTKIMYSSSYKDGGTSSSGSKEGVDLRTQNSSSCVPSPSVSVTTLHSTYKALGTSCKLASGMSGKPIPSVIKPFVQSASAERKAPGTGLESTKSLHSSSVTKDSAIVCTMKNSPNLPHKNISGKIDKRQETDKTASPSSDEYENIFSINQNKPTAIFRVLKEEKFKALQAERSGLIPSFRMKLKRSYEISLARQFKNKVKDNENSDSLTCSTENYEIKDMKIAAKFPSDIKKAGVGASTVTESKSSDLENLPLSYEKQGNNSTKCSSGNLSDVLVAGKLNETVTVAPFNPNYSGKSVEGIYTLTNRKPQSENLSNEMKAKDTQIDRIKTQLPERGVRITELEVETTRKVSLESGDNVQSSLAIDNPSTKSVNQHDGEKEIQYVSKSDSESVSKEVWQKVVEAQKMHKSKSKEFSASSKFKNVFVDEKMDVASGMGSENKPSTDSKSYSKDIIVCKSGEESPVSYSEQRMKRKADSADLGKSKRIKEDNTSSSSFAHQNVPLHSKFPEKRRKGKSLSPLPPSDPLAQARTESLFSLQDDSALKSTPNQLDPVSIEEDGPGTTIDETAVMQSQATFGDLSYDYDLHD